MAVVIITIVLASMSKKTDARYVFTEFSNETGWPNGMAWILGLLQSALSMIGFDACLHMTEEMPRPAEDAPRAMLYAVAVGGVTYVFLCTPDVSDADCFISFSGTAFLVVILFCMVDPTAVLSTNTGMPITELILQATGSRAAATILTLMLAVCFINGTNGCVTSASRLIYAMARDGGIVYPRFFSHISPSLQVPTRALVLCFVFNAFFGLLYLGPTVAFSAYAASCTVFLNISYVFPVVVLLIRGRQVLVPFQRESKLFKLGKTTGTITNWIAAIFVIVTSIVSSGHRIRVFLDDLLIALTVLLLPNRTACVRLCHEYVDYFCKPNPSLHFSRLRLGSYWYIPNLNHRILGCIRSKI